MSNPVCLSFKLEEAFPLSFRAEQLGNSMRKVLKMKAMSAPQLSYIHCLQ